METKINKIMNHDYLMKLLDNTISSANKKEIEKIVQGFNKPPEWVPITGDGLLIGITSSGGAMVCCKCFSFWSLNYEWLVTSVDEETKHATIKFWEEKQKWWECPCCTYESTDK